MAGFVRGDVVIIPFPFSDLSGSKKRPALVLADLTGDDIILCQITSQPHGDKSAITLTHENFSFGSLPVVSYVRPFRIFTTDKKVIIRKAASVKSEIYNEASRKIIELLK